MMMSSLVKEFEGAPQMKSVHNTKKSVPKCSIKFFTENLFHFLDVLEGGI